MISALIRHGSVFAVYMQFVLQFRLRTLVWFLVGAVNVLIILLYWWAALVASDSSASQSFSLPQMTSYYLLMFSLATFSVSHAEEDIAYHEIYKGDIYGPLLRPYPYLLLEFQKETVWRILGGLWALLLLLILQMLGISMAVSSEPRVWLATLCSCVLGMVVSFFLQSIIGFSAFWLTSVRGILDLTTISSIILAGFVIPLSLLPEPLQTIAYYLPYASVVYAPVSILTQNLSGNEINMILLRQIIWLVALGFAAQYVFRRGVRHYTGVSQ